MFLIACTVHSAEVTLYWDAPDDDRVAGYRIYYGKSGNEYKAEPKQTINSADENSCDIAGLDPGQVYAFTATSVDGDGNESDFSDELFFNVAETSVEEDDAAGGDDSGDDSDDGGQSVPDDTPDETPDDTNDSSDDTADSSESDGSTSAPDGQTDAVEDSGAEGGSVDPYYAVRVSGQPAFDTRLLKLHFSEAGTLVAEELFGNGGEPAPDGRAYTTDAGGRLTIGDEVKGTVSTDKKCFVAGNTAGDASPTMMFGIRQSSGLSAADLQGEYQLYLFSQTVSAETGEEQIRTQTGTISADGTGQIRIEAGEGFAGTYSVDDATGQLTVSPDGTYSRIDGVLSENGDIFAGVDTDDSDDTLLFAVGVRAQTRPVDDELAGSYYANELSQSEAAETVGTYLKMTMETNGSYEMEEIEKTCVDCGTETSSGNIVSGENGRIEAIDENEKQFFIGLAPDTGVFTVSSEDSFGIGIRESSASSLDESSGGSNDDGGGGSGGGCFIGSALNRH
ncbi:MAG: fibronectin type III domain-containing protein [Thermodesulfobacteriota bacterium]